jgi:SAM-dependent methyltransferase
VLHPSASALPTGPAPDLLAHARDRFGGSAYDWVSTALRGVEGPVAHLRSAPAYPADRLTVRLDRAHSPGPPSADASPAAVRRSTVGDSAEADPRRLPVRTDALAGIAAVMCLPTVRALDELFGELRRVLRPTGTLAALVPARPRRPLIARRGAASLPPGPPFRHPAARDHLAWLFAAADFAVLHDERRVFWIAPPAPPTDELTRALTDSGVWPPDPDGGIPHTAQRTLDRLARSDRRVAVPLRLLIGRR